MLQAKTSNEEGKTMIDKVLSWQLTLSGLAWLAMVASGVEPSLYNQWVVGFVMLIYGIIMMEESK